MHPTSMLNITSILLPGTIIDETIERFSKYGEEGVEAFGLWVGDERDDFFHIREVWIPPQENTMLSYYVTSVDVHRINVKLNRLGFSAIAQLHTHPGTAFHSYVDDSFAILLLPGSLSIVIPKYGNIEVEDFFGEIASYKLQNNEWRPLSPQEVNRLFKII